MTAKDWHPIGFPHVIGEPTPDVFIALPTYSQVMVEFAASLLGVLGKIRCKIQFWGGDSLVTRARDNVTHEFLKTSIPRMLFMDVDLVVKPDDIVHLLLHGPGFPIVGGCYPRKKVGPVEWILNAIPGTKPDANGLQEVYEMGTGLLSVHRGVFGAMRESYPQLRYRCDGNKDIRYDFFPVGTWRDPGLPPGDARYLSEDWYFCQLARHIGFRVYADTKCCAQHIGTVAFPFPPDQQTPQLTSTAALTPPPDERPFPRLVEIVGEKAA